MACVQGADNIGSQRGVVAVNGGVGRAVIAQGCGSCSACALIFDGGGIGEIFSRSELCFVHGRSDDGMVGVHSVIEISIVAGAVAVGVCVFIGIKGEGVIGVLEAVVVVVLILTVKSAVFIVIRIRRFTTGSMQLPSQ